MSSSPSFNLTQGTSVWRADALARPEGAVRGTGFAALDAQLPGGGWPVGAMVELLQPPDQHHEWQLLLPALARLEPGACSGVVLVGAPHVPFGPALAAQGLEPRRLMWIHTAVPLERLWAAEQALRCAGVVAVLAWLPLARPDQLRRLQMAAVDHAKLLFVMRPAQVQGQASPAVLRLYLLAALPGQLMGETQAGQGAGGGYADGLGMVLHLLKRRGPPLMAPLLLRAGPARLAALLAMGRTGASAKTQCEADHALDCTALAA